MRSRWFVVFSKMCFICNVFFLAYAIGYFFSLAITEGYTYLAGIIITVAYFSFILNFINACILVVLLLKGIRNAAPVWLLAFNIFTFVFQFFFFF